MNQNFCIMPWIHLHVYPNSDVVGCCVWDRTQPLGSIKTQSLIEIANSPEVNQIRSDMLQNKPIKGCSECQRTEQAGGISKRMGINTFFTDDIQTHVDQTNSDGSITYDFKLKSMNIRYSNLCNYSCRTCGPANSSLWAQENKTDNPVIKITDTVPNYVEQVMPHLPYVKFLNFAGGESILIPEHWQILDKLLELGNSDVQISYVTNLSKLTYNEKYLIDYIKQFKNFSLVASLDSMGERAEIYRHGTVWNTVERNLRTLDENNIKYQINCTVGAMNIWHLPDMHRYLHENNFSGAKNFRLTNLVNPEWYSSKILPLEYKAIVQAKLQTHIAWLDSIGALNGQWTRAMNFMMHEDQSELLPRFISETLELDQKRNENSLLAFPELESVFNS